jgi:hypothetical protein
MDYNAVQNALLTGAFTPGSDVGGLTYLGTGSTPQVLGENNTINNTGSNGTSAARTASASDLAYLNDQQNQLNSLLGRTNTNLTQGLTQNQDQYDYQLGGANQDKTRAYQGYADQRQGQQKAKQSAYDTINQNANTGYRSLAQIIGRHAGTGSSAYQELLPNAVGTDTSSKRFNATNTYGDNLQGIDKAQNNYDVSFEGVLQDLMRQKKANEEQLRSGVESQRQGINSQLEQIARQKTLAQNPNASYQSIQAAGAPYASAIENSRNAVEGFFNQFRTPYTAQKAVAATPDMSAYNTDRSNVNAAQQGQGDNPYASLLRKKLQGA